MSILSNCTSFTSALCRCVAEGDDVHMLSGKYRDIS
jgi:hypothetical protein